MKKGRNKRSFPRINIEYSKDKNSPQMLYLIYRYKKDELGKRVMLVGLQTKVVHKAKKLSYTFY